MSGERFKQAEAVADTLVARWPRDADHFARRGAARRKLQRVKAAIEDFGTATILDASNADHHAAMGSALLAIGKGSEGEPCFLRALQIDETHLSSLLDLGRHYEKVGKTEAAQSSYMRALVAHPTSANACHLTARMLHFQGKRRDAAALFMKAIENDPDMPEPYRVLAAYLREAGDLKSAIGMYDALLKRCPDDTISIAERAHCLGHVNDWTHPGYRDFDPATPEQLECGASPFLYLAFEDSPAHQRSRSERHAKRILGRTAPVPIVPFKNDKIRIGYFSADFHDHATMHLMAGVLEAHDKERFEIYCYSYGPDLPKDMYRLRAVAASDNFVDIAGMGEFNVAELARTHQLDIAIDLKGFTGGTRIGLFAYRAAPVQIAWLGYPGTTGAPCMDYIIGDAVVIPPGAERHYSEKVLRMPACYQPNDAQRPRPDPSMTRAKAGLPATGFVFSSLNASYKISPAEFDIWMDLLREVDGSVLWLLDCGAVCEENLRNAAATRGIDPARLIFAPRVQQTQHIARLAMADLFLDTFFCNAHTSASDALWAGVPVLTVPGQQFAARVAASLLHGADMADLICDTPQAYHDLALDIACDPTKLAALKDRLIAARNTASLFDPVGFTRDFETLLNGVAR